MKKNFYTEKNNHAKFYSDAAKQVVQWNAIAMNTSAEDFIKFSQLFDQDKFELQIKLVEEELKEYRDAVHEKDHVEMLDAAADIFVVSSFLVYMFFGSEHVEAILNFPVGDHLVADPLETFQRSREACTTAQQVAYVCAGVFRMAKDSLISCNYKGKDVLTEVLRSNNSKFPSADQLREKHGFLRDQDMDAVIRKELEWLKDNRPEYSEFTATYNDQYGVYVFHDGNGKIMKPSTFSPANVKQFVGE